MSTPPSDRRHRRRSVLPSRTVLLSLAIGGLLVGGGTATVAGLGWFDDKAGLARVVGPPATGTPATSASPTAAAETDEITLSAVGDMIQGAAPNDLPPNGGKDLFDEVADALHSDLQMGNLEQPITNDTGHTKCGTGSTSCFAFRVPPSYARNLKNAGFDLVNQANNHGYDFGPAGYANTRDALDAVGIKYTGKPGEITVVTVKGIKVAVVGFAPYPWAQSLTDLDAAAALVKKAAGLADLVVVQAHVGAEGRDKQHVQPGTEMFLGENRGDSYHFARRVIDAGASVVIMHGPHVMRGMEFYKGHLIAYSLGNFVGYKALNTEGNSGITGILKVTLRKDGTYVSGQLIATEMVAPGVPKMDPDKRAISFVGNLSTQDFGRTGAIISKDGTISPP
jgi:hypothetical protein